MYLITIIARGYLKTAIRRLSNSVGLEHFTVKSGLTDVHKQFVDSCITSNNQSRFPFSLLRNLIHVPFAGKLVYKYYNLWYYNIYNRLKNHQSIIIMFITSFVTSICIIKDESFKGESKYYFHVAPCLDYIYRINLRMNHQF